jgi:hypothetical protein
VQDFLEPVITPLSKHCRWNVDVPALAKEAGLVKLSEEREQLGTLILSTYAKLTDPIIATHPYAFKEE